MLDAVLDKYASINSNELLFVNLDLSARDAPYAKARTQFNRDVQLTRHHGHEHARTAAENGPSLLA